MKQVNHFFFFFYCFSSVCFGALDVKSSLIRYLIPSKPSSHSRLNPPVLLCHKLSQIIKSRVLRLRVTHYEVWKQQRRSGCQNARRVSSWKSAACKREHGRLCVVCRFRREELSAFITRQNCPRRFPPESPPVLWCHTLVQHLQFSRVLFSFWFWSGELPSLETKVRFPTLR